MSDNNGIAHVGAGQANPAEDQASSKGKGKAVEPQSHDMSMDEDDDSSEEEDGAEEDVGFTSSISLQGQVADHLFQIRSTGSQVFTSWSSLPTIPSTNG